MKLWADFRICTAIAAMAVLSGCLEDPYARSLDEMDLGDTVVVAKIASDLAPEDRGVFKTYALRHSAQTKFACGNLSRHEQGNQPETIADAIAFTREWEKEDAVRRAASAGPDPSKMTPDQRYEYELEQLRAVYREVADRQANIQAYMAGGDYEADPEWKKSEEDMKLAVARIEAKLAERP